MALLLFFAPQSELKVTIITGKLIASLVNSGLHEAELDSTHMVLPTLLQPLSNTCVGHPRICIFQQFCSDTASVSASSYAVCSIINHASMHPGTKKRGCGCTQARRHVSSHGLSHAYAHVCTSAHGLQVHRQYRIVSVQK